MSKKVGWRVTASLGVLLLSLALLGVYTGKASAATTSSSGVVQGNVGSSDTSVRSYWTPYRLQHAISLDAPRSTLKTPQPPTKTGPAVSQGPTAPTGAHTASQATTLTSGPKPAYALPYPYSFPWSTVGKVFFTDSRTGANYVCSGTAVTSNNRSTVDTAGHCVANGGQAYFYTNWVFCAQYYYGCPSGYLWTARALWTHSYWYYYGWFAYDYGEAVLNPNSNGYVVNYIGGAGWAYNFSYNQYFYAFGFPAAYPFDGGRMWYCPSAFYRYDNPSPGPTALGITCDMTGGSSGGGWLISVNGAFGYLNGHNDYKYTNDPAHMFSPYYGNDWFLVYNAAQNS